MTAAHMLQLQQLSNKQQKEMETWCTHAFTGETSGSQSYGQCKMTKNKCVVWVEVQGDGYTKSCCMHKNVQENMQLMVHGDDDADGQCHHSNASNCIMVSHCGVSHAKAWSWVTTYNDQHTHNRKHTNVY